jgi:hypothetical protein
MEPGLITADDLDLEGVFESHLTVEAGGDLQKFRMVCAGLGVKAVLIEAPGALVDVQPMTSAYHRGCARGALAEAEILAGSLRDAGFLVRRAKLEAMVASRGVPATDADGEQRPGYFEFHVKTRLSSAVDTAGLASLCAQHGGRLSSNAFRQHQGGLVDRFVTLRAHRVGRATAEHRFRALLGALAAAGVPFAEPQREFVVFDSDHRLDIGWI